MVVPAAAIPIIADAATSLVQCSSSYTRDQPTTLAAANAVAPTQACLDASAAPAATENACTACDDGNECHSPDVDSGENRHASFVLSGR